jgi:SAM-dependent methyltransferase
MTGQETSATTPADRWQFVSVRARRLAEGFVWSLTRPSPRFWDVHYRASGASGHGSRGDSAAFKAAVTNRVVTTNAIQSVVEFGCGDGYQLGLLSIPRYIGLDVSPRALGRCIQQYGPDFSKSFLRYDPSCWRDNLRLVHADMALSMDVVSHLAEDDVFEKYMTDLFAAGDRFVLIYSTNDPWRENRFTRHRRFTDWVSYHAPDWRLRQQTNNPDGSGVGFYLYAHDPEGATGGGQMLHVVHDDGTT